MDDEVDAFGVHDPDLQHPSRAIRADQHDEVVELKTRIGLR